eukprot:m.331835 g.331835  ORF g.331835 m.331835 type:complete len:76 (-) comp55625_c0_seq6:398-625(-)
MLFFYHLFVPIQVLLTDYFAHTMDNLRFNIALNATAASCEVSVPPSPCLCTAWSSNGSSARLVSFVNVSSLIFCP